MKAQCTEKVVAAMSNFEGRGLFRFRKLQCPPIYYSQLPIGCIGHARVQHGWPTDCKESRNEKSSYQIALSPKL